MFYERYLQLCEDAKIAPSAAATKAGFNRGTVSVWKKKYEAGMDVTPDQDIVNKICDFFGCTESWVRGISSQKEKSPSKIGEGKHHIPDKETLKLLELLETREDIRYLAAASERATPEHVKATAKMFDELYGRNQDK